MSATIERKTVVCIVLFLAAVMLSGAIASAAPGNPPVADFIISDDTGPAPHTVTITDTSSGSPFKWEWSIDNKLYDIKPGPYTLTFPTPGNYKIGLVVENQYGTSFTEKTVTVTPQTWACDVKASATSTTLNWGEDVIIGGTVTNCSSPVSLIISGPGIHPQGALLDECSDIRKMPLTAGDCPVKQFSLDSNGPFSIAWETASVGTENDVVAGKYTLSFIEQNGKGTSHSLVVFNFTSPPTCFISAMAGKEQYQWGEQVKLSGVAIHCPNGIKVKMGSTRNGPAIPQVTPAPYGSGIPEGIDLATGIPGTDATFSFTFDTKSLQQDHSLKDGKYAFYVVDMTDEKDFSKVELDLGKMSPATVPCTHVVYLYDGKVGDISRPMAGIGIEIIGSDYPNTYSLVDLVNTTTTDAGGRAVLIIPGAIVGKWKYFHIRVADPMPAGYGWQGAKYSSISMTSPSFAYNGSEICGTDTIFWIAQVPGMETTTPGPWVETTTPVPWVETTTPVPAPNSDITIIEPEDIDGGVSGSIIDFIFSIPRTFISIVSMQPPDLGKPVPGMQSEDSVSVYEIQPPPDNDAGGSLREERQDGIQVVVLPKEDAQETLISQFGDSGPDVVIVDARASTAHMTDNPVTTAAPTRPPVVAISVPATSIANEPEKIIPINSLCPTGHTRCSGGCADLQNDVNNCGGCGNACQPEENCIQSQCREIVHVCPTLEMGRGQTYCNGACVDLLSDENNCGACGNICTTGASCTNGQCVVRMVTTQPTRLGGVGTTHL